MAKSKKGTGPDTSDEDSVKAQDTTLTGADGTDSIGAEAASDPETPEASASDTPAISDTVAGEDTVVGEVTTDAADAETVARTAAEDDGATPYGEDSAETPDADHDGTSLEAQEPLTAEPEPEMSEGGSDVAATETDDTVGDDSLRSELGDTAPEEPVAATSAKPQIVEKTVVERKGGFGAMVLGGVVAAALGYAAGSWPDLPFMGASDPVEDPFQTETRSALTSQGDQLEQLAARLDETAGAVSGIDLAPLADSVAALQDGLAEADTSLSGLGDHLTSLDERLTALEKQPMVDAVSPEAIAAYERELQALRDSMAEQKATLDAQREEIQTMARDAVAAEANADEKAQLAESNTALADVMARVQDGRPYAEPLSVLAGNGVDVPAALQAPAEEGVPTIPALAESFPDVAREALTISRREAAAEGQSGGLTSFFQNQLGARSVTPREGEDADAVLSRAEAAVKAGDLDTALDEISTLPASAQDALSGWVSQAELRRDALVAAQGLAQELNNAQGSE